MKTNKDFLLREVAGESILVPTGAASQELNGMIQLTETAALIWKQVDEAENLQQIVEKILEEYEVDEETARQDVYGFLQEFYNRNMVMDIPEFEEAQSGE